MQEHGDVVVVGGGISGLTAATSLAKRGVSVLLIEKNDVCGGLVNSFTRDGFLFDGGVRAIENAGMVKPMLQDLDIDLHLYRSDVSIGVEDGIIGVEREDSADDYETLLRRLYPDSQDDVVRIVDVIRKFDDYMQVLFGGDSPFFKDAKRDKLYYLTTFVPWVFRFLATGMAVMRMRMPVEDFLNKLVGNRSLVDIISQHFFRGTPAFFAMGYFSLYRDYFYPKGGVGQIPSRLEEKLVGLGARVLKNTSVTRVDLARTCVTDQGGNDYTYRKLIWAADLKQLYRMIVTEGLPAKSLPAITAEQTRILSRKGAESVFTVFMGVDQPPEVFASIAHGHFFYTPSRAGLGSIQRRDLRSMLENWKTVSREKVLSWLDGFCRLNTYEISIPVLNDPQAAPPGKTGIIASLLLDYELVRRIADDGWYEEFETAMENRMLDVLSGSVYKGLKEHLLFKFSAGPLSIEKRVRSSEGAIVGWSLEEPVPVDPGMLNMKNSVRTTLPDIFKIGQWAVSPAGIPTCILTAKLAADLVHGEISPSVVTND